ncbi:DUF167 family protein [Pleomorphomonas carboxyditropha]|uniref:UPF0235 protein CJ014_15130 n=1 Tax=Pleomorphomonas carboxyditropha TaxID=2023338 RepID=A0A2G9WUE7_9HYPH|nr:DUF167 family protein [Pleomorphomonas carboxyditropha]PIO98303.1 hypothetical protein CJ014_15130 [Pleomorphomonas carboxyditropha]
MADAPIRRDGADLLVEVRLTPRGGADRIDGMKALSDGRSVVAARVKAVPEDGKANAAVAALMAAAAGLPKSSAAVVSGSTARLKTIRLTGASAEAETRLRAACGLPS